MEHKRNVLNSPRLRELKSRRRRAFLKKLSLGLLLFLALFSSFAYLARLPGINIEQITVAGNNIVSSEDVEDLARKEIAGKYLWLIPKTNVLFYPENRIRRELAEKFKRLENIELSIKNNRILEVSVTEREPLYTWCGEEPDNSAANPCYFLDRIGYIFDEAPYFSGDVYFKFFGSVGLSDPANPAGQLFAKGVFEKIVFLKDYIASLEFKPVAAYIKGGGDVDIFLSGNPEPKILFRAEDDMAKVAENLSAALDTEPLKSRITKEYSRLEYLDLRFGNKVYSKFR